ncbi:hypothetical protein [Brevundimonas nasdae]|uniref:hypothetical protein n=1 Tax=Brevundimonas nasdae TaxID=172043 RepID=UPI0028A17CA9|nr:hypothetical protein [Brevundimonas nasdae]
MATEKSKAEPKTAAAELEDPALTICGVIMPISTTVNFSEAHWERIQTLLHRGIRLAGFQPTNVWVNDQRDRVSERIIGNIFTHEIVVADISDLNPNVMFELGLRLASKRPTVVVMNKGGQIPFDIRDFHVLQYPSDMNILDMEAFYLDLSETLINKHNSFKSKDYRPFLDGVIVEVTSPSTREVTGVEAVLTRLDQVSARLSGIENTQKAIAKTPTPSTMYSVFDANRRLNSEASTLDLYSINQLNRSASAAAASASSAHQGPVMSSAAAAAERAITEGVALNPKRFID